MLFLQIGILAIFAFFLFVAGLVLLCCRRN